MPVADEPLLRASTAKDTPVLFLGLVFVAKLLCAAEVNVLYTFVPFLSHDRHLSIVQYRYSLMALEISAVFPTLFPFDRLPLRCFTVLSQVLFAVSCVLPPVGSGLWALCAVRFITGLMFTCLTIFGAKIVSELVSLERRTWILALMELSWTGGTFCMSLAGVLLDSAGIIATDSILAVSVLLTAMGMWITWPPGLMVHPKVDSGRRDAVGTRSGLLWRGDFLLAVFAGSTTLGVQSLFMTRYGGWLEEGFSFNPTWTGLFTNAIAIGNLIGNGLTQGLAASIGMEDRVAVGVLLLGALVMMSLIFASGSVVFTFMLVLLYAASVECTFLNILGYLSRICDGEAHVMGMAVYFCAIAVTRCVGNFMAPYPSMTWLFGGSALAFLVCALMQIVSIFFHRGEGASSAAPNVP